MRIEFREITSGEPKPLLNASRFLEEKLSTALADEFFGDAIDEFFVVIIAVDPEANEKFKKGYHKVGKYKDPFTMVTVRHFSIALLFDPESFASMSEKRARDEVVSALLHRLENIDLRIPKNFDYAKFLEVTRRALQGTVN